ncbi:hypothetical protein N7451_000867 [Penicillium sp. IBT 35674x]|nr:hypothetical protein N7451_000867 [Penicillium sp. IBT 35674x]
MTSTSQRGLFRLPFELWDAVLSYLSNQDIKSMRLVCRQFSITATLPFQQVFLSANPLTIEVFHAIADHEIFRHRVTEIIWDDTRFIGGPPKVICAPGWDDEMMSDGEESYWGDEPYCDRDLECGDRDEEYLGSQDQTECPWWFWEECYYNLGEVRYRRSRDVDRPDHLARSEQIAAQPPWRECWEYYQGLLRQQGDVLAASSDENAFLYGLERFPSLSKITITPSAHGYLFSPLYATPMIRAFPRGFNYPIPHGWSWPIFRESPLAYSWNRLDEAHRDKFRGFRIVMRALAEEEHNISQLIIDAYQQPTGINCTIFDEPCEEYDNLVKVLQHPGFRRLDLALIVRGNEHPMVDWRSFRNGRLRQGLSQASDMEEFRLRTTASPTHLGIPEAAHNFIPLLSIFPFEKWSKLHHFELSRFFVKDFDIISMLAALPLTVRSVQLGFLSFVESGGSWYSLAMEMRKQIQENILWSDRDTTSHPKITIVDSGIADPWHKFPHGRAVWIEKELHDFLYRKGQMPFDPRIGIMFGFGTWKDLFEPSFERPYDSKTVLKMKGNVK